MSQIFFIKRISDFFFLADYYDYADAKFKICKISLICENITFSGMKLSYDI